MKHTLVVVATLVALGGAVPAYAATEQLSGTATADQGSTPRDAPPRSVPSQESVDWVKEHTYVAPDQVAMGNTGAVPGPTTWWTWNGPVECPVMPVDGACPMATVTAGVAARTSARPAPKAARRVVVRAVTRSAARPVTTAPKQSARPTVRQPVRPAPRQAVRAVVPLRAVLHH